MKPVFSQKNVSLNYDYQCYSILNDAVVHAMLPFLEESYYGPDSLSDKESELVETVKQQIKDSVCGNYVYFTSSGSHANNLISNLGELAVSEIEHKSLYDLVQNQSRIIKVDKNGQVNKDSLLSAINTGVTLVSIQLVNQDTGIIQDVRAISKLCREHGVKLHVDACSAFGYMEIDMVELGIDYMSISARKIGGPPGIGAIVSTKPIERTEKGFIMEGEIMAGPLNYAAIAGFGEAINQMNIHKPNLIEVCNNVDKLKTKLQSLYKAFTVGENVLPNTLCVGIPGVQSSFIASYLKSRCGITIGIGASDSPGTDSRIYKTLGLTVSQRNSVIRLCFTPWSKRRDIESIIFAIGDAVREKGGIRIG